MARLWATLQGPAKELEELSVSFVSCEKALSHRCLCLTPTRKYRRMVKLDEDQEKSFGDYIVREQRAFREMTEALRRVRNSRSEKSGVRRHDHRATSVNSSVCSEAEYEMVEDEDAFVEAPWRQEQTGQTFFELEIRGYRLLQKARLSREERQMVLAGTGNDTEQS